MTKLAYGVWATEPGEIRQIREDLAVFHHFHKTVELMDPLTPAGREYLAFLEGPEGARRIGNYEEFAIKHRRSPPAVPPADLGPSIGAYSVYARNIAGKPRRPREEFKAPEGALAEAYMDGIVQLVGRPSPRFNAFIKELEKFRQNPVSLEPYPAY